MLLDPPERKLGLLADTGLLVLGRLLQGRDCFARQRSDHAETTGRLGAGLGSDGTIRDDFGQR